MNKKITMSLGVIVPLLLVLAACAPDRVEPNDEALVEINTDEVQEEAEETETAIDEATDTSLDGVGQALENAGEELQDDEMEIDEELLITANGFTFSEQEVYVTEGDRVRITFASPDNPQSFVLDAFNVSTPEIGPGDESVTITFVADEPGTYTFYSGVGSARQQGLEGTLYVQPRDELDQETEVIDVD
jgi:plastocyanin